MIFITVGTSNFGFERILEIIDQLCEEDFLNKEEIFAQIGVSEYIPKNYKYIDMTDNDMHKKYIRDAEYIITHAGTGCITSALKLKKKIIAFPRLKKYHEHIDDHQSELVEAFYKKKHIMKAINKEELKLAILEINDFEPNPYMSNTKNFEKILEQQIRCVIGS